jgi:tetratricopeptide (TPR) repeat protein
MSEPGYRVFLSAVSSEFATARNEIASDLTARGLTVKVQRDFRQESDTETTLAKLAKYIRECDAVVHVAGQRSGAFPGEEEAKPFLQVLPPGVTRASLTQFEFHFARHFKRKCYIYIARPNFAPDKQNPTTDDEDPAAQAKHVLGLEKLDRDYFASNDQLCRLVLKSDWPTFGLRRPCNLPYPSLETLFVGRDPALADLRAALGAGGHAAAVSGKALHGLGGVGKTRLAVEYAWRHAGEYSALLFVPAETPERLSAGLAALAGADALDLPQQAAASDAEKIAAARQWLARHPTWLMILDNVDDAAAVAAVAAELPRLGGGHALITARATQFPAAIRKLELGALAPADATRFLLDRTKGARVETAEDSALARELADELGGLALGLEQAGAYIVAQRIGFTRYLRLWREQREKVLGWFDKTLTSYNHDVGLAATWATSVEKLSEPSRRLMRRLAFFAPDPIPDFLLDVATPGEAEDLDTYEARAGLYAYSLLSPAGGAPPGFAMHRLVQDFVRRGLSPERADAALREALGWVNAACQGEPWDVRTWSILDPLAPHALALARSADAQGVAKPTARLFVYLGGLLKAKARWREAEPFYRRALEIDEASLGPTHPTVAIRLNNLAQLLQDTNRLAEAEPLLRRALAIFESSLGPTHPNVATGLNNLALLLRGTNHLAEAEPLMRRALEIDEASFGPTHPNVAIRINNLAQLLQATNRLAEAEPLMRRALEIDEASFGSTHPNVAVDLNNLASLLQDTNRLAEAEPLMRRALAIDEASFGPMHPDVARDLNNLAQLLQATDRLAEAAPLMRRALEIDEASFGPTHPRVASHLNNLANLLQATNRLAEAEPHMWRALEIDEASFGPTHPKVAIRLSNLASLLYATNRLAEAEPFMRRALAIFEASFGPEHPSTAIVRRNLVTLLAAMAAGGDAGS